MKYFMSYIETFKNYRYLLYLLVKKDIKKKYQGSILGIIWSLLNPLLNMIILTIVFSTLFHRDIENFPVYMLSGKLLFEFFTSTTLTSTRSVISARQLINKVYVPKYLFTISRVISDFVFFLISMIDLLLIMLVTNFEVTTTIIYGPLYLILIFIFTLGVSMILATYNVFFRDLEYLYKVITTVLVYLSAIFFPPDIIPQRFQFLLTYNPIYTFISGFREVVYYHNPLDVNNLMTCFLISISSLIIGIFVFLRNQDKFIIYI